MHVWHAKKNKVDKTHLAILLQPLPILKQKWESISMDFITVLPKFQGKDCIFVVVDRLTKFTHFLGVASTIASSQVFSLLFRQVFKLHGFLKAIISYRDNKFTSAF